MTSEFKENAEDLNTADSVQVDGNAIRRRVDALTGSDHYRFTIDGIEYDAHWAHDTRRLLDENARLNAENDDMRKRVAFAAAVISGDAAEMLAESLTKVRAELTARDRTVEALSARLTAKNAELDKVIREAAADKARLAAVRDVITPKNPDWKPLSERYPEHFTPDTPEEAARKKGWRQGEEMLTRMIRYALDGSDAAPEMPRPPATMDAPEVSTAIGSTGVPEPKKAAQAVEWGQGADCPHRPEWHCENHGECRGCECGCGTVNPELDLLSLIPDDLIKSDPGIRGGEPCITGTRIPASEVAGYLADGATWDEVREMLPSLPSLPVPSTETRPDYQNEPEGNTDV